MKNIARILVSLVVVSGVLWAHPTVSSVSNNASYIAAGLPNAGIAQGAIFVVFGQELGPASLVKAESFPLPTTAGLGGTSISVTVGGTTVQAIMLYALATQLGAVLPSKTPVGDGMLTVTYNGQTGVAAPIHVVKSAFGIFAVNQAGSGPAVVTDANYAANLITNAFAPGQVVILWGTGLGPVSGDEAAGPLPGDLGLQVEVLVGGKAAKVNYAGRSGCCSGVDQIAFEVPAGMVGCYVPVVVRVNGVVSNWTSMSISSNGPVCSDPTSFSAADIAKAQSSGKISVGGISLTRTAFKLVAPAPVGDLSYTADIGGAVFYRYDYSKLIESRGTSNAAPIGACTVYVYSGSAQPSDPVAPTPLDAGPTLNLSGPGGKRQMPKMTTGGLILYSNTLGGGFGPTATPLYLSKGMYTVDNGSGGADVGPFTATLNLPDPLVWTNEDAITNIPRSQDLLVTWTGGDTGDPNAYVYITGSASTTAPVVGGTFVCAAPVSAGRFTVPSVVLSTLPISAVTAGISTGSLSIGTISTTTRFTAPGLDVGGFGYYLSSGKAVNYQ